MFGESESESPRVPSPWDSLISGPPSPVPSIKSRTHTPSPLAVELIPRLVPESDDGNVEYKLQLLNPSPARFARLVTQMKWRLLEGGGQAYYELGVADSGDLIGLPREELERSLETLEMMAGEIGASVIVVKEIEVPAVMATLAKRNGNTEWPGGGGRRSCREGTPSSFDNGYSTGTTETETENDSLCSTEEDDLSMTVVLERASPTQQDDVFAMDPDTQDSTEREASDGDALSTPPVPQARFLVDLEISSVFKPRPMRARMHNHPHYAHSTGGKTKRVKKYKHLNMLASTTHATTADPTAHEIKVTDKDTKSLNRRQARDRRREEKRKALEDRATATVATTTTHTVITEVSAENHDQSTLIPALEGLHVGIVEEPVPLDPTVEDFEGLDDYDDVFPSPKPATASFPTFSPASKGESHLDVIGIVGALGNNRVAGGTEQDKKNEGVLAKSEGVDVDVVDALVDGANNGANNQARLIVEALVVRKMSLEEAFLDFGGFSLT